MRILIIIVLLLVLAAKCTDSRYDVRYLYHTYTDTKTEYVYLDRGTSYYETRINELNRFVQKTRSDKEFYTIDRYVSQHAVNRNIFMCNTVGCITNGKTLISGSAVVIDGDTIKINDNVIQLYGIDSPEKGQVCLNHKKQQYDCGERSADYLTGLTANQVVSCIMLEGTTGKCFVNGKDINGWMVANGMAISDYKRKEYLSAEKKAKNDEAGLWSGQFTPPHQYEIRYNKKEQAARVFKKHRPTRMYRKQ